MHFMDGKFAEKKLSSYICHIRRLVRYTERNYITKFGFCFFFMLGNHLKDSRSLFYFTARLYEKKKTVMVPKKA